MLSKQGLFEPEPIWHLIGHLQTNKVKYVIEKVKLIQSVDSMKLVEEISKRAGQKGLKSNILIEINIGNEATKQGIEPNSLMQFCEQAFFFPNVRIQGLMCVAPFVKNPEDNKVLYEKMYKLYLEIKEKLLYNNDKLHLSMGMSNDYAEAIEEGATMVRVGTALFGSRG
jgi:pyridoxal phosphate enzyme (YggS family)